MILKRGSTSILISSVTVGRSVYSVLVLAGASARRPNGPNTSIRVFILYSIYRYDIPVHNANMPTCQPKEHAKNAKGKEYFTALPQNNITYTVPYIPVSYVPWPGLKYLFTFK